MKVKRIYIGGWFQRTTLHLTEIWYFVKHGRSDIDFVSTELAEARANLEVYEITRESDRLEYLRARTRCHIEFRVYEDGLIILEKPFTSLSKDFAEIKDYYDNYLSPGLSFIFSKGAPVPKELANIKTILPYIVTIEDGTRSEIEELFHDFEEEIYSVLATKKVEVYRSPGMIVINNLKDEELMRAIIESQIFFREFKSQLHRYLAIHRVLWEKISRVKERGVVKGTEIDILRNELSDYQKTINLIGARINQMGTYIKTRQKVADIQKIDEYLNPLFQFKFETLQDTHEYIKHLWEMTKNYLASALEIFSELQARSTKNTISSLQLITTIGVVAGIFTYLNKDALPRVTLMGLFYFVILLGFTWVLNTVVSRVYKGKKYQVKGSEIVRDIK